MEEDKFLPPKFSFACNDLATQYRINDISTAISTLSKTSSDMSIMSVSGIKDKLAYSTSFNKLYPIEEIGVTRKKTAVSLLPNSIRLSYNSKTSMSALHKSSPSYK